MKAKIQIIDLIISDINKFLIQEKINPVNITLIQLNGTPVKCEGDISDEKKIKINERLKKYKNKYEIIKLIIEYKYGNITKMQDKIGKKQIGKRYKNFFKTEAELMGLIDSENIIKLK